MCSSPSHTLKSGLESKSRFESYNIGPTTLVLGTSAEIDHPAIDELLI